MDMPAVGAVVGPGHAGGANWADPDGGHAQGEGGGQVAGHILDHHRAGRVDAVGFRHLDVDMGGRLGIKVGGDDVEHGLEMMAHAQFVHDPLRMGHVAVGEDDLAARKLFQRRVKARRRVDRVKVDIVHGVHEGHGIDPVQGHQAPHGRAVFAEIGFLQRPRLFQRQIEQPGDIARDVPVDLIEQAAGRGIERVVQVEHPAVGGGHAVEGRF